MATENKTVSMFPSVSEWVPPQSFPDLSEAKEIAIDLETCDPKLMGGQATTLSRTKAAVI